MSTDVSKYLGGSRIPTAKFPNVGDLIGGAIIEEPEMRQMTDFKTGEPLFWPNGDKRMQLVLTMQTQLSDGPDDDGRRRLFVKGQMREALIQALKDEGAQEPAIGGILLVTRIDDGEPAAAGLNPAKQYIVTYGTPLDAPADGGPLGTAQLEFGGTDDDAPF